MKACSLEILTLVTWPHWVLRHKRIRPHCGARISGQDCAKEQNKPQDQDSEATMAPPPPPTPATGNFHQQLHQQPSAIPPPPTGQNIAPSGAFPGSLTPGWNDPPPVSADALTSNANNRRPRLDLRKRVAHPLDGKSGQGPPSLDASSPRPVAMVPPQRQLPYPDPHNMAGGAADAGTFGGAANANAMRLPPLAQAIGIDPSKVPVAMVPPRQK